MKKISIGSLALIAILALVLASCSVTIGSTQLAAPSGVSATLGKYPDKTALTWNSVSGAVSYNYYVAYTSAGTYTYLGNTVATSYNYLISSSNRVNNYYFKVSAVNSSGTEGYLSNYVLGYANTLAAPTSIIATNYITREIDLTWYPVTGAVAYEVYDVSNPNNIIDLGPGILGGSGLFYIYIDLLTYPGNYTYEIESIDAFGGYSYPSSSVTGTAN